MRLVHRVRRAASLVLTGGSALVLAIAVLSGQTVAIQAAEPQSVQFNRDIRPILAENCFQCHGPDPSHRKSGLRLDLREAALKPADSGELAIVPNQPQASSLVKRIESDDPGERMPPADSKKQLSAAQKELLKRWIAAGAPFELHWSFVQPQRPELPKVEQSSWPRNAIDWFVLARLEKEGLAPAPEADNVTLFRRLSLDLTGLPPQPADVDAFVREMAEAAGKTDVDATYARWVEKLLSSPHFGERMAVDWLDAARFADSNGYQVDRDRENYAWRDWVIRAFNDNQPFDQFTIEQIAGDLLPQATLDQKIATGFHRNHMLNEEGGIIGEEFLAEYCADRVETTATVWLAQTLGCARCHDHKYDPFTQRDFYGLFAFFHNVNEAGVGNYGANIRRNAPPMIKLPAPELEAQIAALNTELAAEKQRATEIETSLAPGQPAWEQSVRETPVTWIAAAIGNARIGERALSVESERNAVKVPAGEPQEQVIVVEAQLSVPRATALRLEFSATALPDAEKKPLALQLGQLRVFRAAETQATPLNLRAGEVDGSLPAAEVGKAVDADANTRAAIAGMEPTVAVVELDQPIAGEDPAKLRIELSVSAKEAAPAWELRVLVAGAEPELLVPTAVLAIVRKQADQRTPPEQKQLTDFRSGKHAGHRAATAKSAALAKQIDERDLQIPTALVMQELPQPRKTHILMRGAYDKKGEEVAAATPGVLPPLPADLPRNRLGLARWLVDPRNPLTARVTVNRFWQSLFGTGLVRTSEDFGIRGEPPSHPELLDWLAVEFAQGAAAPASAESKSGATPPGPPLLRGGDATGAWDVKRLLRLIVTSSTYRQSSRAPLALRQRDPENRLLARGPRFRLQAEFLRDQALAASGLLVRKVGGPSVKPYHPPGLYEQVVAGSSAGTYVAGAGDDLHRRSLYTYWKRSVPNPAMLIFDVPFRESCTVRRSRTNTPLQSLNLLNDPTYVEAARFLAERMLRDGGDLPASRITHGFRLLLARSPRTDELNILTAAYHRALRDFQADPASAAALLTVGAVPADSKLDQVQLAALTTVASIILNLDETLTKE